MGTSESTIHPQPGDVILVRLDRDFSRQTMDELRNAGKEKFPGHEVVVVGPGITLGTLDVDQLEKRVKELEDRVNEAGRRALFHAGERLPDRPDHARDVRRHRPLPALRHRDARLTLAVDRLRTDRYAVDGGTIAFARLPLKEAARLVHEANTERQTRRDLLERPDDSPAEIDLVAALLAIGATGFTLQHPLGPYDADIYFEAELLAVEVDGQEYHDAKRDKQRDRHIRSEFSVKTIRFPAREVWRDCVACAKFTAAQVGLRRKELAA